jgi:large subunit ribosomal protein L4
VVFGPHPRKYTKAMPKKMRRLAIRSALSAKQSDSRVTVVRGLADVEPKTKAFKGLLGALPESRSYLIVTPEVVETISRGAANLTEAKTIIAGVLNVRDVLKFERLVVAEEALAVIEQLWALPEDERTPSAWRLARQAAAKGKTVEEVA